MPRGRGPEFTRFLGPVVQALREKGGTGAAAEVIDRAIEILAIPEVEQAVENKNGGSRVRNQAQWARFYLDRGGLLRSSRRGIWELTDAGAGLDLKTYDFQTLFQRVAKSFRDKKSGRDPEPPPTEPGPESGDYRTEVLSVLRALPAEGFERLCQRLLRESGFEQVVVTGRSGDGGIDGIGVLQLNPFVSFNVLFQCKKYTGTVTPSQIRDFRGAMQGRADKGIILTTGSFTVEAKKEARRDGAPPIELVDGDDLIKLLANLELGLKPRTTYDLDESFFEPYRNKSTAIFPA
jgi:restriction system protein